MLEGSEAIYDSITKGNIDLVKTTQSELSLTLLIGISQLKVQYDFNEPGMAMQFKRILPYFRSVYYMFRKKTKKEFREKVINFNKKKMIEIDRLHKRTVPRVIISEFIDLAEDLIDVLYDEGLLNTSYEKLKPEHSFLESRS